MGPLIEELRARIRASGLRYAEIEQRAGFSKKYLSQLVNGHVDLKIFQLFKILVATEVESPPKSSSQSSSPPLRAGIASERYRSAKSRSALFTSRSHRGWKR